MPKRLAARVRKNLLNYVKFLILVEVFLLVLDLTPGWSNNWDRPFPSLQAILGELVLWNLLFGLVILILVIIHKARNKTSGK